MTGRLLFSAAEESYPDAVRELRDEFGRGLDVARLGPDLGAVAALDAGKVAAACRSRPLVFPRHLTVEVAHMARADAADPRAVARAVLAAVAGHPTGPAVALQAWVSGEARIGYGSGELARHVTESLTGEGFTVSRAGQRYVVSCAIAPNGVHIGLSHVDDSLSDWPGGRVRLARDAGQVSRSEFKLEELFQTQPLDLPAGSRRAVDLGASPGGWTRVLRRHGLAVWSVDPGNLDPRVTADAGVHHVRTTAGEFLRRGGEPFDLVANDMRMDPLMSSQVTVDAAGRLRHGGLAVVTLKTGSRRPVETVRRCLSLLRTAYDVVYARQLHHNRREVTVVVRRPARRVTR
jgi:23S rRNA (cytidine2498-2'-O)-methyltransferase